MSKIVNAPDLLISKCEELAKFLFLEFVIQEIDAYRSTSKVIDQAMRMIRKTKYKLLFFSLLTVVQLTIIRY